MPCPGRQTDSLQTKANIESRACWSAPATTKHRIADSSEQQITTAAGTARQEKGASYKSNCSHPLQTGLFRVNWEVPKEQKENSWPK